MDPTEQASHVDESPEAEGRPDGAQPTHAPRAVAIAAAAALLAGLASFAGGEATPDEFVPSPEAMKAAFDFARMRAERVVSDGRHAAIDYGMLGGALGLALGLAGGLVRGTSRSRLAAAATGLVLGGLAGAAPGPLASRLHAANFAPTEPNLVLELATHAGLWGPLSAAAGIAFGLGLGGRARASGGLLGGLVGGLAGLTCFVIINALVFPTLTTEWILPQRPEARLLGHLLVSLGVGAGAALGASGTGIRTKSTPTA